MQKRGEKKTEGRRIEKGRRVRGRNEGKKEGKGTGEKRKKEGGER